MQNDHVLFLLSEYDTEEVDVWKVGEGNKKALSRRSPYKHYVIIALYYKPYNEK